MVTKPALFTRKIERRGLLYACRPDPGAAVSAKARPVAPMLEVVQDKPLISYGLTTLITAGCREVVIATPAEARPVLKDALGDGARFGIDLSYLDLDPQTGVTDAILQARSALGGMPSLVAIADHFLAMPGLSDRLQAYGSKQRGAVAFVAENASPSGLTQVAADARGRVTDVGDALLPGMRSVVGLVAFDARAPEFCSWLMPSESGQRDMSDLLALYSSAGELSCIPLSGGDIWIDMTTDSGRKEAAKIVGDLQARRGTLVGSPELAAFEQGFMTRRDLAAAVHRHKGTSYGEALRKVLSPQPVRRAVAPTGLKVVGK